jgi:tetratricopeptide (TPR) repeat protein
MSALILSLLIACQTTLSPEMAQHIQTGIEAQKQGRLNDAIAAFRKVTEMAPDLPAPFVSLGQAYMQNGNYDAAIAPLKRALTLNPGLAGARQMLGFALLSAGYAEEAIPHLEKVQALDALGLAQLKTGKLAEAIGNLQAALAQRPGDPDLLYYLGRAAGLLSKQTFDALRVSQPDSARAHQILGETYSVLRNIPGAEQEFREAIRLRPATPGLHLELGELYVAASQWDKAEAEFRAETRLQPGDAETAFQLGSALLREGRIKDARLELERANGLAPGMPETLYSLGKAASLDGDKPGAEKAWLAVIAMENGTPLAGQAHFGLAGLYREQGKTTKAASEMQEFQRIQRTTSPPRL